MWVFAVLVVAASEFLMLHDVEEVWSKFIGKISQIRDGNVLARMFDYIFVVKPLYLWRTFQQGVFTWRLIPVTASAEIEVLEDDPMGEDE